MGGFVAAEELSLSFASKADVIYLTKAPACELAPPGIRVDAIAPGQTASPGNYDLRAKPVRRADVDSILERTPSGRVFSEPKDMARAALFLASEDSRAMYGSILTVDEGYTAGM